MSKIPDKLKEAILTMPQKEKDKLLLRLIAKDENLVQRLNFEIVEQGDTLQLRRDELKVRILRVAKLRQDTAGLMMMDMRSYSGDINHHVKITKDKYGEVELHLYLLNAFFDHHLDLLRVHNSRTDSCAEYIAKKTATILKNLAKLNEDYYGDFEQDVNKLLRYVHQYCPKSYARDLGIVKEWPKM